jgi:hypothetical protein
MIGHGFLSHTDTFSADGPLAHVNDWFIERDAIITATVTGLLKQRPGV